MTLLPLSGWSLVVLILLLLLILYLRGAFYKKVNYHLKDIPGLEEPYFPYAIIGVSNSYISSGYPLTFRFEIDAIYAARLEAIRSAQRTIHIETFYMTPGRRPQEFADALIERSQAGVEVQLLLDSFGVISMPKAYWKRLEAAGVQLCFFHQFSWKAPLSYNIRTHRKLILIDGEVAIVGGMGISDYWDGRKESGDLEPWLDVEVCFQGPVVAILEGIFMQHWIYEGKVASLRADIFNPALSGGSTVLVTPSDSPSASSAVYGLFYTIVLAAKERIWIASPYFLPDSNSVQALLEAKRKGVDVRILTVGPHNDKKWVYYAVRERYEQLLSAGIEIHEYHPSMMHAKVLLIDGDFVSTGNANFYPRSLFHNEELNLSLVEPQLAKMVEDFFLYAFTKSRQIYLTQWRTRPVWQRLVGQAALFFRWQL